MLAAGFGTNQKAMDRIPEASKESYDNLGSKDVSSGCRQKNLDSVGVMKLE